MDGNFALATLIESGRQCECHAGVTVLQITAIYSIKNGEYNDINDDDPSYRFVCEECGKTLFEV